MTRNARKKLSRARWRILRGLIKFVLISALLGTIAVLVLKGQLKVDIDVWAFLRTLNDNNGTVTAIATVVLVTITAFYTVATFRLVSVTLKLRSDQIRPIFQISSRVVGFEKESANRASFDFEIELVNFGPSPAIGLAVTPSIAMLDKEGKIYNYLTTDPKPKPPIVLHQNVVWTGKFSLHADNYDEKAFADDFFEVELLYQDVDMNLYHQQDSYWMHTTGTEGDEYFRVHLSKDYEVLHMMEAARRTTIADSRRIWWTGDKSMVIFERTWM
jgi:hypothetical protein